MVRTFEAGRAQGLSLRVARCARYRADGNRHPVAAKEDDASRSLGLDIHRVTVREPNDLHQAFAVLAQRPVDAVVVPNTSLLNPIGAQIAELAAKHRLPTIGSSLRTAQALSLTIPPSIVLRADQRVE